MMRSGAEQVDAVHPAAPNMVDGNRVNGSPLDATSHPGRYLFLKRVFAPGTLAILDQGLVSLNSFATMLLLARFCSTVEVSIYALAWSLLNVARVAQERTLGAPYVILVHQSQRNADTFTGSSLIHQGSFSVLTSLLFFASALIFGLLGDRLDSPQGLGLSMTVIGFAGPFILLRDHLRVISGAHLKYHIAVALNGTALLLQLSLLYSLHRLEILSAAWAFACMGLANLIPVTAWLLWKPVSCQPERKRIVEDWKATIQFSRWLIFARLFPTVSGALLPWIVFWFIGGVGAAVFATCMTLSNIAALLILGANSYLQLKTVLALKHQGIAGMNKVMRMSASLYSGILVPIIPVIWLCGDWVMITLFGQEYGGHQGLLSLLVLHTLLISFSTVFGNGMSALDCPRGLFPGEIAYAFVAILLACGLTAPFGLAGIGIALCLAGLTSMITSGISFRYSLRGQAGNSNQAACIRAAGVEP